jgi:arsenate reductase
MAEGFLRAVAGDRLEVASAGTEKMKVHPLAIRAMSEEGIDISRHTSKTLDEFLDQPWDYVITVCDSANESCPMFPAAAKRLHWSFPDPASAAGSEEVRLATFRQVRDAIEARVSEWLASEQAR